MLMFPFESSSLRVLKKNAGFFPFLKKKRWQRAAKTLSPFSTRKTNNRRTEPFAPFHHHSSHIFYPPTATLRFPSTENIKTLSSLLSWPNFTIRKKTLQGAFAFASVFFSVFFSAARVFFFLELLYCR